MFASVVDAVGQQAVAWTCKVCWSFKARNSSFLYNIIVDRPFSASSSVT